MFSTYLLKTWIDLCASRHRRKKNVYDEGGRMVTTGKDVCDCLMRECPGCFYPCENCGSPRCGRECRANRKWQYSSAEVEGGGTREFPKPKQPDRMDVIWCLDLELAAMLHCELVPILASTRNNRQTMCVYKKYLCRNNIHHQFTAPTSSFIFPWNLS